MGFPDFGLVRADPYLSVLLGISERFRGFPDMRVFLAVPFSWPFLFLGLVRGTFPKVSRTQSGLFLKEKRNRPVWETPGLPVLIESTLEEVIKKTFTNHHEGSEDMYNK